ncbi:hypothetical protein [Naasia aerilata]|uniref:Uncharacterized protein n=1 Tax=Naasia aerilata TaxID=1162966 RepID=A0ABN6XKT4_9MICO|nr:hypothetical protein [Naasia aerilata]BDZ44372.1 hypothetical protein GCM10025866_02810 [Naasia aerilata]
MLRTRIRVANQTFYLAQGHDPELIKMSVVEAALAGAGFVSFVEVGNRTVSVLVTAGVSIVVEHEEVAEDVRDDGDLAYPFDPPRGARAYASLDFTDY